jgi:chromosome segregation ATPase
VQKFQDFYNEKFQAQHSDTEIKIFVNKLKTAILKNKWIIGVLLFYFSGDKNTDCDTYSKNKCHELRNEIYRYILEQRINIKAGDGDKVLEISKVMNKVYSEIQSEKENKQKEENKRKNEKQQRKNQEKQKTQREEEARRKQEEKEQEEKEQERKEQERRNRETINKLKERLEKAKTNKQNCDQDLKQALIALNNLQKEYTNSYDKLNLEYRTLRNTNLDLENKNTELGKSKQSLLQEGSELLKEYNELQMITHEFKTRIQLMVSEYTLMKAQCKQLEENCQEFEDECNKKTLLMDYMDSVLKQKIGNNNIVQLIEESTNRIITNLSKMQEFAPNTDKDSRKRQRNGTPQ